MWHDQSDVSVLVRVKDEVGGVQCQPTAVQIRATPTDELSAVFSVIPQVCVTHELCQNCDVHVCNEMLVITTLIDQLAVLVCISCITNIPCMQVVAHNNHIMHFANNSITLSAVYSEKWL